MIRIFFIHDYYFFWGDDSNYLYSEDENDEVLYGGFSRYSDIQEWRMGQTENSIIYSRFCPDISPDLVVVSDLKNTYKCWKKLVKDDLIDISTLYLGESGVVDWKCSKLFINNFRRVFPILMTYRDDLINEDNVWKQVCSTGDNVSTIPSSCSFEERKLITMICGYRKSHSMGELYSMRTKLAKYLDRYHGDKFDLYGGGWNAEINCWRGRVKDKVEVYSTHKFAVCFENHRAPGYITEKIFDCFSGEIVPVYYGANNITDYIPKECFIDYSLFNSFGQLVSFLEKIDETEYQQYIRNIRTYMSTEKSCTFSTKQQDLFQERVANAISSRKFRVSFFQAFLMKKIDECIELYRNVVTRLIKCIESLKG